MPSRFSSAWLFATPWTVAHQAPLSIGFSRQEYWSGSPCPPPGDLPHPEIEPASPASPTLQADSLPTEPLEKPYCAIFPFKLTIAHILKKMKILTRNCLYKEENMKTSTDPGSKKKAISQSERAGVVRPRTGRTCSWWRREGTGQGVVRPGERERTPVALQGEGGTHLLESETDRMGKR